MTFSGPNEDKMVSVVEGFLRKLLDLTENKVGQPADIGCLWTCSLCCNCLHAAALQRQEATMVNSRNSLSFEENSLRLFI